MKKYYIGLVVICLVTLGFVGYVGYQGISGKEDSQTEKKANEIAPKLNDYVSKNQKIPESFEEAGIQDVPDTIKYTKISDKEYKFCVTYKMASSYNFSDPVSVLSGVALGGGLNGAYGDIYSDQYPAESLYLYGPHKQGENCQTVKPYLNNSDPFNDPYNYNYDSKTSPLSDLSKISDNSERQKDINAIHSQVEQYYALNGRYPTLSNLNSADFRVQNMNGLDDEDLSDPKGLIPTLVAAPAENAYAYAVFGADGTSPCDNINIACAVYALTATNEGGGTFEKTNLN